MRFIISLLAGLWLTAGVVAQAEIHPRFAMESDPELKGQEPIEVFPIQHRPLWLQALARPEADLQRRAAEAIAEAHLLGTPGLAEAMPTLVKILAAEMTHPTARFAAARALIVLEAHESAETLFVVSLKYGTDLRQLIEPALAKWKYQPIRQVWQQRLQVAETRHRDLLLAINGVQAINDDSTVPALLLIVHDPMRPQGTRLAAARVAGQIQVSNLEPEAEKLLQPAAASVVNRLCAASLLRQHHGQFAQALLLRLAQDEEPTIAAAALTTLNFSQPKLVLPIGEQVLLNRDANVRLQGVATYFALATPERVTRLARLLDDPHPDVRGLVRERLFVLDQEAELSAPILRAATEVLADTSWRGQEQAALLLAALEHKPAAARLVQLLDSPRGEVQVASAWGLRVLAVQDTLPAIQENVQQQLELRLKLGLPSLFADAQVGHLCEALGLMKYAPAEPLLRRFVPKDLTLGELSRGGAIWALGQLHTGVPDEPLAQLLTGRLTEPITAIPSELTRVRIASAISLGRMKAKSQTPPMRKFLGPNYGDDPVALAIRWAIRELTGETLPAPERSVVSAKSHWFLERLD